MRLLIDKSPEEILDLYQQNLVLGKCIQRVLKIFVQREDQTSLKATEV